MDELAPNTIMLKEQVIRFLGSDLTFTIWRTADGEGRIRIGGDALPYGNRDLQFGPEGDLVGTGTAVGGVCPSGLRALG